MHVCVCAGVRVLCESLENAIALAFGPNSTIITTTATATTTTAATAAASKYYTNQSINQSSYINHNKTNCIRFFRSSVCLHCCIRIASSSLPPPPSPTLLHPLQEQPKDYVLSALACKIKNKKEEGSERGHRDGEAAPGASLGGAMHNLLNKK